MDLNYAFMEYVNGLSSNSSAMQVLINCPDYSQIYILYNSIHSTMKPVYLYPNHRWCDNSLSYVINQEMMKIHKNIYKIIVIAMKADYLYNLRWSGNYLSYVIIWEMKEEPWKCPYNHSYFNLNHHYRHT